MKSGQVLIIGIIFVAVASILTISLFSRVADFLHFGSNSILNEQATQLAEAGVDSALWQLNKTPGSCPSEYCGSEQTLGTTGSFIVRVEDKNPPNPQLKTITATGYVPNATNPRAKRTVRTDVLISSESISFHYAVQTGEGGVVMYNSATINGTVYSNGNIEGYNSSKIDGEAYATGTVSSPDPTITHPPPHPNSPEIDMPIKEEGKSAFYQEWKDAASAGGSFSDCSWTNSETDFIGPRKCTGNFSVSNSAQVTIQGPIYVVGTVNVSNSGKVILDNSFGSNGTIFITDQTVTVANGGQFVSTSASPKGYILVVTTSTNNVAISISNQGVNAIFYALDGGAQLSNQAKVTALVAKRLIMNNTSTLDYDSGLASAQFSSGPGGSWQIKKGTYRFTSSP